MLPGNRGRVVLPGNGGGGGGGNVVLPGHGGGGGGVMIYYKTLRKKGVFPKDG